MKKIKLKTNLTKTEIEKGVLFTIKDYVVDILENNSDFEISYKPSIAENDAQREVFTNLEYVESLSEEDKEQVIKVNDLVDGVKSTYIIYEIKDPAYNENLVTKYTEDKDLLWVNKTTGEVFVCISKTYDKNIWIGQLGTKITPPSLTLEGVTSKGLILHLPMDKVQGSKIKGADGLIWGTKKNTNIKKGMVDKCLYFKGNSSVTMDSESIFRLTGAMTICYNVKPRTFGWRQNHFWKDYNGEYALTQETDGSLTFYYGDGTSYKSFNTNSSLTLNQWHRIAIIRDDSGNVTIRINEKTQSLTQRLYGSSFTKIDWSWNPLMIGNGYAGGFKGYIDDMYIFDRALPAYETDIINKKYLEV